MDTTTAPLRHIKAATSRQDAETAATIVAAAFAALDATRWLVPDAGARTMVLKDVFGIVVEHAQVHGQVDLLVQPSAGGCADGEVVLGAAVWFHHDHPIPPPAGYDQRLQEAAGPHTPRFHTLDRLFEYHHPVGDHHHYLAFLAALPASQGLQVGSALLRHHHAGLASLEMPAYLEAAGTRTCDLYRRHGYHRVGPSFEVPNGATFYPMWRTPNAPKAQR